MSHDADKLRRDDARIDLEAAAWLMKRDRALTAAEQDDYLQWLAADPRHSAWIARHQQTWQVFDRLAQWRPEHSAEPNPDLLARPRVSRWGWLRPVAFALAASVAVAVGVTQFRRGSAETEVRDRRPAITLAADAYERHTLDDGSVVELNRDTELQIDFRADERRVTLRRGEAHFSVEKDPARPFVVRASALAVRAVGTAFNVRLASDAVDVLVTEGRVELESTPLPPSMSPRPPRPQTGSGSPAAEPAIVSRPLDAGQRAIVAHASAAPEITAVNAEEVSRLLAWQPRLLDFSSTPLGEVIAELNRRNRTQLVLADAELRAVPIVASIRSDNVEGFVRMLSSTAGVRVEHRGRDEIVLHRARE